MFSRRNFILTTSAAVCGTLFTGRTEAASASTSAPKRLTLTTEQRHALMAALAREHDKYNPVEHMIALPASSPGYHTTVKGGQVHDTRASLIYAAALLDSGQEDHLNRAKDIIRKLISLQDQNPANKTYGIWSWFLEEPLEKMSPPDWNWADFCSVQLLHAWIHHRDRLGRELADATRDSILHAARSIKKRNVGPGYTNIAIMGTYVSLMMGEQFGEEEFGEYGRERLRAFHAHTFEQGSFSEYNSPVYTIVALEELSRMLLHVQRPEDRKRITEVHDFTWKHIADHFHPPTRQWAGPHSRSYGENLSKQRNALPAIQAGTGLKFIKEEPLPLGLHLYRLPLHCPENLLPRFTELKSPRLVVETFTKADATRRGFKNPIVGTTYLHPRFTLGTVNRGDFWNQRRAVIAYWGTPETVTWFRFRFLRDYYDYCSALVFTAQHDGNALVTVGFATDYGVTHPSLDRPKVPGVVTARDFRLRLEFGGDTSGLTLGSEEETVLASDSRCAVQVRWLGEVFENSVARVESGTDANVRYLDRVFYSGEEREFDFANMAEAFIAMTLSVTPAAEENPKHGSAELKRQDDLLTTTWISGLSVSTLRTPALFAAANDAIRITAG